MKSHIEIHCKDIYQFTYKTLEKKFN